MDDKEKERFRKQLEMYKKELGISTPKKIVQENKTSDESEKIIVKESTELEKIAKVDELLKRDLSKDNSNKEVTNFNSEILKIKDKLKIKNDQSKIENDLKNKETKNTFDNTSTTESKENKFDIIEKNELKSNIGKTSFVNNNENIELNQPLENLKNESTEKLDQNKIGTNFEKKKVDTNKEISNVDKKNNNNETKREKITYIDSSDVEEIIIKKEKKSKWLYFIIAILILVSAFMIYSYLQQEECSSKKNKKTITNKSSEKDRKNNIKTENLNKAKNNNINISDTIYNIESKNPKGYYVVLGAYGDMENAINFKNENTFDYDTYIFEGKMKRVTLFISDNSNQDEIMKNLRKIKLDYPNAWLLYNTTIN